ncbi:MAG TPA: hypothetical protein VH186_06275 [Chloroflexia bacterium]|nr:hypothetical protein [Chloroflexia bacterium]
MNNMKKTVFTLNINYNKEITQLTYPLLHAYAEKIGAEFYVIQERKFKHFPVTYEKLQIYELGQQLGNDWNIFFDVDALIHPDLFDVTTHLQKDTVMHNGADIADNRWTTDRFFMRDGRHIGSCNWFTVASDWCIDLWKPLDDLTLSQAMANIHPIVLERNSGVDAAHLIDDYTLSRNIAKFGLKFTTMFELKKKLGDEGNYVMHPFPVSQEEKIQTLKQTIVNWGVTGYYPASIQAELAKLPISKS